MPWNVRDGRERCANDTGRENSWRETQYAQLMILVGLEKIVERSERIGRRPYRFDKSARYWRVWIIKSDGPETMGLFTWRVLGNSRSDSFCRKSDASISRSWWMKVKTRRQETNSKLEWGWTSVTGNLTRNMDYLPILMKDTESIGSPPEPSNLGDDWYQIKKVQEIRDRRSRAPWMPWGLDEGWHARSKKQPMPNRAVRWRRTSTRGEGCVRPTDPETRAVIRQAEHHGCLARSTKQPMPNRAVRAT
jgi:hypothetical protein